MALGVRIFLFRDVDLLCSPRYLLWVKWLWFSSTNSVWKHRCLLFFSARISLTLFLRRRQRWKN